jgi:hypothetical protein
VRYLIRNAVITVGGMEAVSLAGAFLTGWRKPVAQIGLAVAALSAMAINLWLQRRASGAVR